jgi:lipopolysaccharide export system permease protein
MILMMFRLYRCQNFGKIEMILVIASQLGWRIFAPFSMFVALALAVALSEVTPRQGRYLKLFPALMIFASMIVLLIAAQTRISRGEFGIWAYP